MAGTLATRNICTAGASGVAGVEFHIDYPSCTGKGVQLDCQSTLSAASQG
jgi:hypothetical protein